jgi:hypothetical protein
MVNEKRGEVKISLGEKTLTGRVTIDGIIRIESALGMGIVQATKRLSEGALTTAEVMAILYPILKGGGNDITDKDVKALVWDAGLSDAIRECGKVLIFALNSGKDEGNELMAEVDN